MAQRRLTFAHTDFSGGQINESARQRDDLEIVRAGAKVQKNTRLNATGQLSQRPGHIARRAVPGRRTEPLRMGFGYEFKLHFSAGVVTIYDEADAQVAHNTSAAYLWTDDTIDRIVFAVAINDVVITYPGMRPQILRWEPIGNTWSFLPFAFASIAGATREPFLRFSIPGESISYSATTGAVTLATTADYFDASKVGTVLSILGQQVAITGFTDPQTAQANVVYRLPDAITIPVADVAPFIVGQIATAQTQNIKIEIGAVDSGASTVTGVLMSGLTYQGSWTGSDRLISPVGESAFGGAPSLATLPVNTVQWQEEFMSDQRGWPSSCFYDRGRLGFCDFPQRQEAVLWSAILAPDTFWIDSAAAATQTAAGSAPDAAVLEFVPDRPRVRHVVGWGDVFVFTDRGLFQIPVSASSPLKPGSVEFRKFADDGCSGIRPLTTQDSILFINAGLNRVSAVRATGSYSRPYVAEDTSFQHTDLFTGPVQMTIATGDGEFPERFCHVLNADGTRIVGKIVNSQQQLFIGWAPWASAGRESWVVASGPVVMVTAAFAGSNLLMDEDGDVYLDAVVPLNDVPPALDAGRGPFWFLPAGSTVTLMNGARDFGERVVDTLGNVVPVGGEDLSDPALVGGLWWTESRVEIWPRLAPEGPTVKQRVEKRQLSLLLAKVRHAVGVRIANRFFPIDDFGSDATAQPIAKSAAYKTSPLGRSWDPVASFVVERPGPFDLLELTGEVTL